MPGSETFSPFFAADIRTPFFSADVLKKFALIVMHLTAEEVGRVVVILLIQETRGDTVAQRVQYGKVRMKLGLKTTAFRRVSLEGTLCAMVRCTSSGCVGQDWELAKVALSCHIALDMLCQEMHEAWQLG